MSTATLIDAPSHAAASTAGRLDLYAPIHKALRRFMGDTLDLVGTMDVFDAEDMIRVLGQLQALLTMCERHIVHENTFVHAAIEARQPQGAQRTADDHLEHAHSIEALRQEARGLSTTAPSARPPLALRLYRHLALFVAENLQHMHFEETVNNAALWALYSDDELHDLHEQLLASIPPHEHLEVARWMVPAMSPAERAGMLNGMRLQMPPEAFMEVLTTVRPHLDDRAWDKLARDLKLAATSARA